MWRRSLSAAIILVLVFLGLTVVSTASAAAAASSSSAAQSYDGCTAVPEAPSGISFTYACNQHDICYGTHSNTRAGCDAEFYELMVQACAEARSVRQYYSCRTWAGIYYWGVRLFGAPYYNATNPANRIQTPLAL